MLESLFISRYHESCDLRGNSWYHNPLIGLAPPRDALNVLCLTEGFDHIAIGWARDLQQHHGQHGQCDQPFLEDF